MGICGMSAGLRACRSARWGRCSTALCEPEEPKPFDGGMIDRPVMRLARCSAARFFAADAEANGGPGGKWGTVEKTPSSNPSQTCTDPKCHPNPPLFLKIESRSGYCFLHHSNGVAKTQFYTKFDGSVA